MRLFLLCFLVLFNRSFADEPLRQRNFNFTSNNAEFEAHVIYGKDKSSVVDDVLEIWNILEKPKRLLWKGSVGFNLYPGHVYLSDDGLHIMTMRQLASQKLSDSVVRFYKLDQNSKKPVVELNRFTLEDLNINTRKLRKTVSHYAWLKKYQAKSFDNVVCVWMIDEQQKCFNFETGEIIWPKKKLKRSWFASWWLKNNDLENVKYTLPSEDMYKNFDYMKITALVKSEEGSENSHREKTLFTIKSKAEVESFLKNIYANSIVPGPIKFACKYKFRFEYLDGNSKVLSCLSFSGSTSKYPNLKLAVPFPVWMVLNKSDWD